MAGPMDRNTSMEEVEEEIQLATQADRGARQDDDNLARFEDLFRQMKLNYRLEVDAQTRLRKWAQLPKLDSLKTPQQVVDTILPVTLKNEEASQIHEVCQNSINACQFSLILQSHPLRDSEKYQEDLAKSSVDFLEATEENLRLCHELERLDGQLRVLQNSIQQREKEIAELKQNPEATAGKKSEKIEKLETQLDKSCGRYDFARFLTQLLLMASEEDLNHPKITELFVKCGISADD